ncbi:uncharacterized protein TrAtP1_001732 [Trichoderma atroviride]|uniref:uncharacterized protein n=1 Tax=Hypocrea atroviridis TaxID=63577 RepID=UPI003330725B|nr:hypothetical protein TrAtP1_001732 [Trichoderma atroviride]
MSGSKPEREKAEAAATAAKQVTCTAPFAATGIAVDRAPSSGAPPEGSSAPVLQCPRSPKPCVSSASRPGSAALWMVPSTQDAWGHVMQTSSISSCKVTTLAVVIPA